MASVGYHEPIELLSEETREMHRALVSLMEELEAIDWYRYPEGGLSHDQVVEIRNGQHYLVTRKVVEGGCE